jgi:DNA-binding GntR family transcriptional regulator
MSSGRVVDYIEQGDADAAVKLMEQHLLTLEANVCVEAETPHNSLARMLGLQ